TDPAAPRLLFDSMGDGDRLRVGQQEHEVPPRHRRQAKHTRRYRVIATEVVQEPSIQPILPQSFLNPRVLIPVQRNSCLDNGHDVSPPCFLSRTERIPDVMILGGSSRSGLALQPA